MPRFALEQAEILLERATRQLAGYPSAEHRRAAATLGLGACRAALKAFYEQAGIPVHEIELLSEDIRAVLSALDQLRVDATTATGELRIARASRLLGYRVGSVDLGGTVGAILARDAEASQRGPGIFRVNPGSTPPALLLAAAARVLRFVREHWHDVQLAAP